jgi:uncharacterized protein YbjT (DUF2867 family)
MRAPVTGATGFVGGRLAQALADEEVDTRCLVRDGSRARHLANAGDVAPLPFRQALERALAEERNSQ